MKANIKLEATGTAIKLEDHRESTATIVKSVNFNNTLKVKRRGIIAFPLKEAV
jgi:hypothetical protein